MRSFILSLAIVLTLTACGSSSVGPVTPTGPDLDITELTSLKIDQLKFTTAAADGYLVKPSIYLRCKGDNQFFACAGQDLGMDVLTRSGLVYGGVNIPLIAVEGAASTCESFEVLFVEKASGDCPKTVSTDDTIIATAGPAELDKDGKGSLLNKISSEDGTNWIRFVTQTGTALTDIDPSDEKTDTVLVLDDLYFTRPSINDGTALDFLLTVKGKAGYEALKCKASFDSSSGVQNNNIMYGNLNVPLKDDDGNPCAISADNKYNKVDVLLTIMEDGQFKETLTVDSNSELSEQTLAELVDGDGRKNIFTEGLGFVRFYHITGF